IGELFIIFVKKLGRNDLNVTLPLTSRFRENLLDAKAWLTPLGNLNSIAVVDRCFHHLTLRHTLRRNLSLRGKVNRGDHEDKVDGEKNPANHPHPFWNLPSWPYVFATHLDLQSANSRIGYRRERLFDFNEP
ncbi:MAG: hypothetical protein NTY04_00485, partial [Candidatus Staskawiczbacteria bacterium]|nr:hypothetical protein [Candidatus Staskawiczbacteria bacterium]